MFQVSTSNICCTCIKEPYAGKIADAFAELKKANEHNERVIKTCNQKISELELWNRDYREQLEIYRRIVPPTA